MRLGVVLRVIAVTEVVIGARGLRRSVAGGGGKPGRLTQVGFEAAPSALSAGRAETRRKSILSRMDAAAEDRPATAGHRALASRRA